MVRSEGLRWITKIKINDRYVICNNRNEVIVRKHFLSMLASQREMELTVRMEQLKEAIVSGHMSHLTHLNLWNNEMGADGMEQLKEAIVSGHMCHLTHIDLGYNVIGADGMEQLKEAAKTYCPKLHM